MSAGLTGALAAALLPIALTLAPAAAAAPSCAEGPQIVGDTIYGTPCADTIGPPPRSVTKVFGEGGDDVIFGGRGNDWLYGGEGNDRLYGGIGDDQLRGGPGDDLLSGGFGADSVLDGEAGDDVVRGDATIDRIQNSGGGIDTLSYATGATPGFFDRSGAPYFFPDFSAYAGFPTGRLGRGAYVDLAAGRADNGRAPEGGGFDEEVETAGFEVVIGTAFADYLVGTGADEVFYGGGGADVIIGGGGSDVAYGGAEGDSCIAATAIGCESSDPVVTPRSPATLAVGRMGPSGAAAGAVYLTGSSGDDEVTASYSGGTVTFTTGPGSAVGFDAPLAQDGGCAAPAGDSVSCALGGPPDSLLLAGLDGADSFTVSGFPPTTSVVLLGNEGDDELTGGDTEEALVDGPGADLVQGLGGDDALPNNAGADRLHAGAGEDLFVSDAVCDGDLLDGGPGRDNANWAQFGSAVTIDLAAGAAGLVGPQGEAQCPESALLTELAALEDIEGTSLADVLVGDEGPNQLLGRLGADTYFAAGGDDLILANSGTPVPDPDPTIDCGAGWDTALIDFPENGPDAAPVGCESVEERAPNSFRPPATPLAPNPPPAAPAPSFLRRPPPPDRRPPQTRIVSRPRALLWAPHPTRRVAFRFRADEPRVRFRCRLDRGRYRPCSSPRIYRLRPGRHTFRVYAIDPAGNRDRTPARFSFRIRRR